MAALWEVIGGADKGGIIVRKGPEVSSEAEPERLSTGALVEQQALQGERLRFKRLTGSGPETGWVTLRTKEKELLVRSTKLPPKSSAEGEQGDAPGAGAGPGGERESEANSTLDKVVKQEFNPYKLLGVEHDATDATIKSTFRKASLAVHPDRNPDDPESSRKFRELTEAKEFLLNPFKRRLYNLRHGLLKPITGQVWWSDWDTIFEEISTLAPDELGTCASLQRGPSPGGAEVADILLFGATGITGTLACALLWRGLWGNRTWAICGRDGRKLGLLERKFGGGPHFRGSRLVETSEDVRRAVEAARVIVDLTGEQARSGPASSRPVCKQASTAWTTQARRTSPSR